MVYETNCPTAVCLFLILVLVKHLVSVLGSPFSLVTAIVHPSSVWSHCFSRQRFLWAFLHPSLCDHACPRFRWFEISAAKLDGFSLFLPPRLVCHSWIRSAPSPWLPTKSGISISYLKALSEQKDSPSAVESPSFPAPRVCVCSCISAVPPCESASD